VSPANCVEELERCVEELRFVDWKIHPDPSEGESTDAVDGRRPLYPLYAKMVELHEPPVSTVVRCDFPASRSEIFLR